MRSIIFILMSFNCFSQFPSTASYELFRQIRRAKHIGDTVYTLNSIQLKYFDRYVLKDIDKSGRYVYRHISTSVKDITKVMYNENNTVQSYFYKYRQYGGEGKGYFVIHYYANGNIKDYASIHFNNLYQSGEIVLYDSLGYVEKRRSKIPSTEYNVHYKRKKIYLYKGPFNLKETRKKIRKRKYRKIDNLVEDFPFKTFVLD